MPGHLGARLGLVAANAVEQLVVVLHLLNRVAGRTPAPHNLVVVLYNTNISCGSCNTDSN